MNKLKYSYADRQYYFSMNVAYLVFLSFHIISNKAFQYLKWCLTVYVIFHFIKNDFKMRVVCFSLQFCFYVKMFFINFTYFFSLICKLVFSHLIFGSNVKCSEKIYQNWKVQKNTFYNYPEHSTNSLPADIIVLLTSQKLNKLSFPTGLMVYHISHRHMHSLYFKTVYCVMK